MTIRFKRVTPVLLALGFSAPLASGQEREDVQFQITHQTPNSLISVFVLGDLPELGGGDLTKAVKLVKGEALLWDVTISLPVNRTFTYRYYERSHLPNGIGNPDNGMSISDEFTASTSTVQLSPIGKKIYYHSTFDLATLHWRQDNGAYQMLAMQAIGPGREESEIRWLACGFGEARRPVEFYLTNSDESLRDPDDPAETYETPLDAMFLQDNHLFTYEPAPLEVSPQRRDYVVLPNGLSSTTIDSDILGAVREYRVMLPRGYDEHTDRHYPVVYMHDGHELWDGLFLPPLDPDGAIGAELVRLGEVGETILVGIDNLELDWCTFLQVRTRDLLPPGDTINLPDNCGSEDGEADLYVDFVINELKPLIDSQYRTLSDPQHTWTAGFSLGGLVAMYMGWDYTDTFTRIGSWSGSFWIDIFRERVMSEPWRELRIYMDTGTLNKSNLYDANLTLRDNLLAKSPDHYILEKDLRFLVAADQAHSPAEFGTRLPELMTFLYPATEEPNALFCIADMDCDGVVGIVDFLDLLAAWGPNPGHPADLDLDGIVGILDFLELLAGWGPCV